MEFDQYHANAGRSHNSFLDNDLQKTPRGSVHTSNNTRNIDSVDKDGTSDSQLRGTVGTATTNGGPYQFTNRSTANNKIRVVIRMRPYLDNEHEAL